MDHLPFADVPPEELLWVCSNGPRQLHGDRKAHRTIKSYVMRRHRHLENQSRQNSVAKSHPPLSQVRHDDAPSSTGVPHERSSNQHSSNKKKKHKMYSIFLLRGVEGNIKSKDTTTYRPSNHDPVLNSCPLHDTLRNISQQSLKAAAPPPTRTCIDNSVRDPFNCFAVPSAQGPAPLVNYYWRNLFEKPSLINPATKWMKHVLADKTLMLATLTFASRHYLVVTGDLSSQIQYYQHLAATIRTINEDLDDKQRRCSDGVIAAVANLAASSFSQCKPEIGNMHLAAVERMVKQRGGPQNLGMDGMLSRHLGWMDRHVAAITLSPLRLNIIPTSVPEPGATQDRFCIDSVCFRLHDYSQFWLHHPRPNEATLEGQIDKVAYLEHQVTVRLAQPSNLYSKMTVKYKAFYIAARIYIANALRMQPVGTAIMRAQATLLLEALPENMQWERAGDEDWAEPTYNPDNLQLNPAQVLLWTVFVGGVASIGSSERKQFVELAARKCAELGLYSWGDVQVVLKGIASVDKVSGGPWFKLWAEGNKWLESRDST